MRYEDLSSKPEALRTIVDFFDPENALPPERIAQLFDNRDVILDGLKNNALANRSWGLGHEFAPESMFYEWSLSRGHSNWTKGWHRAAKQAFHETGATELLIELGYETDADWWKQ